jgi:hypothetical protein
MDQHRMKYVTDLKAWELPRLQDLEDRLVEELIAEVPPGFDRSRLGEKLYNRFLRRLRELAQTVVNETIEYWLKGLADGNDGAFPELCLEFPYLERGEEMDALTVVYSVDNEGGTRTELVRTTLSEALMRCMEQEPGPGDMRVRAGIVAAELRALAERIEGSTPARS